MKNKAFLTSSRQGFTLFEIMISMIIFSLLMITAFSALQNIGIARLRSTNRMTLLNELYYFSEQLATRVKEGGTIDYEEYWNRKVVGTVVSSGHYQKPTGFGNYGNDGNVQNPAVPLTPTTFGEPLYYCVSGNSLPNKMGTGGCLNNGTNSRNVTNIQGTGLGKNYTAEANPYQRYGQYALQYMDYNGNYDDDAGSLGDEDGNNSIIGDEDDRDVGDGPVLYTGAVNELYLVNPVTKERTFFRLVYRDDPTKPSGVSTCDGMGGSGCIGSIQVLKLVGYDLGEKHDGTGSGAYDGKIDTWVCHNDWQSICDGQSATPISKKMPGISDAMWVDLFPSYVNVKNLSFSLYPSKDPIRAWASKDNNVFVHPYVRVKFDLGFSWLRRRGIRNEDPTINISTTISLSEY